MHVLLRLQRRAETLAAELADLQRAIAIVKETLARPLAKLAQRKVALAFAAHAGDDHSAAAIRNLQGRVATAAAKPKKWSRAQRSKFMTTLRAKQKAERESARAAATIRKAVDSGGRKPKKKKPAAIAAPKGISAHTGKPRKINMPPWTPAHRANFERALARKKTIAAPPPQRNGASGPAVTTRVAARPTA